MGLSSLSEQSTATPDSRSERELFVDQLRAALPSLRESVNRIINEPTAATVRERLASDLRTLAGSASLMNYPLVAEELSICQSIVQAAAILDQLDAVDRIQLLESLDNVESVLSREYQQEQTPTSWPLSDIARDNLSILAEKIRVVCCGEDLLAKTLGGVRDGLRFEVHHESDLDSARIHLRSLESPPDVVVVDVDDDKAGEFVEWLFDQHNTEDVPVVAVGDFVDATKVARYVALGVARTVAKPIRAGALRRACGEVAPLQTPGKAEALGLTTLDELGGRLAAEVHRGLCDTADDAIRQRMVDLGEGSDVLAIMWEAVRDIRDLVTLKSAGELRFAERVHGDALPREPWLDKPVKRVQNERVSEDVSESSESLDALEGVRVLVAEDDPSTNWFLSGVVSEAGAATEDAMDGQAALRSVYQHTPDLILCDVLLPGMDAWSLCQIIDEDPVLRGTPVVLLSWKPDLLERMRELNVPAAGYLLKEAKSATVMQRVTEALRPRLGLAKRLRSGAAVRGRLDDITPYALLILICRERPDSRLTLRSGDDVFEVDLRAGKPVRVTHTDNQSQLHAGLDALATMLAMRSGRFGVDDFESCDPVVIDLEGTLAELASDAVALLRATQRLLAPEVLLRTQRIELDEAKLRYEMTLTPGEGQAWLQALLEGEAPGELVRTKGAEINALSRLLGAAARRGCIQRILNVDGADMLPMALEYEQRFTRGERVDSYYEQLCRDTRTANLQPDALQDTPEISYEETDGYPEDWIADADSSDAAGVEYPLACDEKSAQTMALLDHELLPVDDNAADHTPFLASQVVNNSQSTDDSRDSVLEREEWRDALFAAADTAQESATATTDVRGSTVSIPPELQAEASPVNTQEPSEKAVDVSDRVDRLERLLEDDESDDILLRVKRRAENRRRRRRRELARLLEDEGLYERDSVDELEELRAAMRAKVKSDDQPNAALAAAGPRLPRVPMPSAYATRGESFVPPKPKSFASRFGLPLLFAVAGIALAVGARWMRHGPPATVAPPAPKAAAATAPGQLPASRPNPALPAKTEAKPKEAPAAEEPAALPVELPLSKKDRKRLKRGEGLLEVVAGRNHKIFVDGRLIGRGPVKKVPLKAGDQRHEIRVKMRGEERVRYVVMRKGVRLRVRVAPPWSR
jgi:CheY-like chemotaxis protein